MKVEEISEFGGPDVFRAAERPDPVPGAGEVVVRIHAACVNPTDLATRAHPYTPGLQLPLVLGWDLAGIVSEVGAGVSTYAPGDRVCGMIPFGRIAGRVGAYAAAAAVQPDWLAPLPENVPFEEGATLPLNSLTGYQALQLLPLAAGARLLITGASGGVGGFATQLAVQNQLHVIAVAGRGDEDWVRSLGPAEVLPREADLARTDRVDGVFDAVPLGPERTTPALRDGGTAVFTRPPQPARSDRVHLETVRVHSDPFVLALMARLLGQGELRTRVARVFPLEDAPKAHRLAEAGGLHGKVVLRP